MLPLLEIRPILPKSLINQFLVLGQRGVKCKLKMDSIAFSHPATSDRWMNENNNDRKNMLKRFPSFVLATSASPAERFWKVPGWEGLGKERRGGEGGGSPCEAYPSLRAVERCIRDTQAKINAQVWWCLRSALHNQSILFSVACVCDLGLTRSKPTAKPLCVRGGGHQKGFSSWTRGQLQPRGICWRSSLHPESWVSPHLRR